MGEGKEGIHPPPLSFSRSPSFFPLRQLWKGEAELGKTPSRIHPTWSAPWLPLLPSDLYMCGEGTPRTHNINC